VVTKKQRRKQLARASAERRVVRRQRHQQLRRRTLIALAALGVILATAALAVWIALHDSDNEATALIRFTTMQVRTTAS
jgi:hypothetical protein